MPKKIVLKTKKNNSNVSEFIRCLQSQELKKDCQTLLKIFKNATGLKPKMWGDSIVGFGEYTYHRSNGDEGKYFETGFSPRKSGPVLYIMPGYSNYGDILQEIGPVKKGKSCLYLKSLENINQKALQRLIVQGLKDLRKLKASSKNAE